MWLVGHKSWTTFSTVIGWHKCWWALIGWAGLVSVSHLWTWPSETCEDWRSFTTVTHSPLLCWRNALKSLPGFHQLYYQETFYTQELVFPLYSKYSNQDFLFLLFHQIKLLSEGRLESSVFSQLCERWTLLTVMLAHTHTCVSSSSDDTWLSCLLLFILKKNIKWWSVDRCLQSYNFLDCKMIDL